MQIELEQGSLLTAVSISFKLSQSQCIKFWCSIKASAVSKMSRYPLTYTSLSNIDRIMHKKGDSLQFTDG